MKKGPSTTKNVKRLRKHGFLVRMQSHAGKLIIKKRRKKQRKHIAIP